MLTLEQQVVSLELAKKMKKLGFPQKSLFYWYDKEISRLYSIKYPPSGREFHFDSGWTNDTSIVCSAYTVAELGEMLPTGIAYERTKEDNRFRCCLFNAPGEYPAIKAWEWGDTEADARAKMLIYLIENKLTLPQ